MSRQANGDSVQHEESNSISKAPKVDIVQIQTLPYCYSEGAIEKLKECETRPLGFYSIKPDTILDVYYGDYEETLDSPSIYRLHAKKYDLTVNHI